MSSHRAAHLTKFWLVLHTGNLRKTQVDCLGTPPRLTHLGRAQATSPTLLKATEKAGHGPSSPRRLQTSSTTGQEECDSPTRNTSPQGPHQASPFLWGRQGSPRTKSHCLKPHPLPNDILTGRGVAAGSHLCAYPHYLSPSSHVGGVPELGLGPSWSRNW
ncbi:hypothetical protein NDU88_005656 [Pleurodeles waltl]|uniref:Uncharacterized protein n=1 Tax=Pleurodeles waltl TaxID=8319 RepID=A0AAV7TW25_PLEWA|nr:hypothetical protein NDU88_005656 [Pleurodeles waltl]